MRVDPLTKLAITYGTDKFGYHDYTPNYYKLFKHLRNKPLRLLEIGVGGYQDADRGGESLEVWRDFFPEAQIVGIDIQKKEMDLGPRVQILQGSQVDPDFLADLVRDHGPFDIIIDDASHASHHQQNGFLELFSKVKPGGLYVIEDLRWQPEAYEKPGITKTAALFRGFSEARKFVHADPAVQAEFEALAPEISGCFVFQARYTKTRRDQVAVIHKR